MQSIKSWIQNSNGWQRLWLVSSVVGFIYLCLFLPIRETNLSTSYWNDKFNRLTEESRKPECAIYMNLPLDQLTEPPFNEGCYSIYIQRQIWFDSQPSRPFTLKSVNDEWNADYRKILFEWIAIGTVLTTLLSAIAYGLGSLTAWVIKGFKKKDL
jgi:hypothetical protein